MSGIDIGNVVDGLKSSRIKDRNEALDVLEDVIHSKARINSKQFDQLVESIFKLIEHEKIGYLKNRVVIIDQRLSRASGCLREIVNQTFGDPDEVGNGKHFRSKLKTCLKIIFWIEGIIFIEGDLFEPCSLDFAKTLCKIVSRSFFKEHLQFDDWLSTYRFLVRILDFLVSLTNRVNEKMITEIYFALHCFLQADISVSVVYLPLLTSREYVTMLPILRKTVDGILKENLLSVLLFKIINKMIKTLATEDVVCVHQLIQLGIKIMITFTNTGFESLQYEFTTFLNLQGTHSFLFLDELPILSHNHNGNNSILRESEEYVLSSEEASNTECEQHRRDHNNKSLFYNLGMLVLSLVSRLGSSNFAIDFSYVQYSCFNNPSIGLYNLSSIFFCCDENSVTNLKAWFFTVGVTKLLSTYFDYKRFINSQYRDDCVEDVFHPGKSFFLSIKRQKVDTFAEAMYQSTSVLEFCFYLIGIKDDDKPVHMGMRILSFYFEINNSKLDDGDKKLNVIPMENNSSEEKSNILELTESTFDFPSIENSSINASPNNLLRAIIACFGQRDINFWSTFSSRSLLFYASRNKCKIQSKLVIQLFKLILPLVKDKHVSRLACSSISKIVLDYLEDGTLAQNDRTLITLLDSLIDLSEVNGPCQVSDETFEFWYTIHNFVKVMGHSKYTMISVKIEDWLFSKWDQFLEYIFKSLSNMAFQSIVNFFKWLCSGTVELERRVFSPKIMEDHFIEGLSDSLQTLQLLQFYRGRQTYPNDGLKYEDTIYIYPLTHYLNCEHLLIKVLEVEGLFVQEDNSPVKLIQWLAFVFQLSSMLQHVEQYQHIVSSIEDHGALIAEALDRVAVTNSFGPQISLFLSKIDCKKIHDKHFFILMKFLDLDVFLDGYTSKNVAEKSGKRKDLALSSRTTIFDEEFLPSSASTGFMGVNTKDNKNRIKNEFMLIFSHETCVDIFRLVLLFSKYQKYSVSDEFERILKFFGVIDPIEFLYCLNRLTLDFEEGRFDVLAVPTKFLIGIIRILGEGVLLDNKLERSEITICVTCNFLNSLCPILKVSSDEDFKRDCFDIIHWLILCDQKNSILTEASYFYYLKLLGSLSQISDQEILDVNVNGLFYKKLKTSTNNLRNAIAPYIVKNLKSMEPSTQMVFFSDIYINYDLHSMSFENGATFSNFMSVLSSTSVQTLIASLFSLLECSNLGISYFYIKLAVLSITDILRLPSARALFEVFKLELLRTWWLYKFDILKFPYTLFEFNSLEEFLISNANDLFSITLSSSIDNGFEINFLTDLLKIPTLSLLSDCLPLCISFSFMKGGIRSDIFNKLKSFFGESFSPVINQRLVFVVLEIIRHVDLSSEEPLLTLVANTPIYHFISRDSLKIPCSAQTTISLSTALQLIDQLVNKYSARVHSFWDEQMAYFLTRQLVVPLHDFPDFTQQVLNLRRLKFLLAILAREGQYDRLCLLFPLASLLVSNLSSFLSSNEFGETVSLFLSFPAYESFDEIISLQLVIKIVSFIRLGILRGQSGDLIKKIQSSLMVIRTRPKLQYLLRGFIAILEQQENALSAKSISTLLNDEYEMKFCVTDIHYFDLFRLLSRVVECVGYQEMKPETNAAKVLSNAVLNNSHFESEGFRMWCAKYLARYYLCNGPGQTILSITSLYENEETSLIMLRNYDRSMSCLLDLMIKYINTGSQRIAAYGEVILGVLLRKCIEKKEELTELFNVDQFLNLYSSYILDLDFHSCLFFLYPKKDRNIFGLSLDEVISELPTLLHDCPQNGWACQLFLAIIEELSKVSNVFSLFAIFVTKEAKFASDALPWVIVIYITFLKETAFFKVYNLLHEFEKLEHANNETTKLFIQILLVIRSEAKQHLHYFEDLYLKLDLLKFYEAALKSKLYKTALMIFEDHHSNTWMDVNWFLHQPNLFSIYESIDSEDLVYGLPEETTLEYAIRMTNTGSNAYERLMYQSSIFDADISFNQKTEGEGILKSLIRSGMTGISKYADNGRIELNDEKSAFEWSWKLNKWDLPSPVKAELQHEFLYKYLKQIRDGSHDEKGMYGEALVNIMDVRSKVSNLILNRNDFRHLIIEWLSTLACVTSVVDLFRYNDLNFSVCLQEFTKHTRWFEQEELEYSENILLSRAFAFQNLMVSRITNMTNENLSLCTLNEVIRYNELCIKADELQKVINSLMTLDRLSKVQFSSSSDSVRRNTQSLVKYHVASSLWHQGKSSIPVMMLQDQREFSDTSLPIGRVNISRGLINATLVEWMSSSRQDTASNIMDKYVLQTPPMIETFDDIEQKARVYELLARFCESQYRSPNLNDQFNKLKRLVEVMNQEIEDLKLHYSKSPVTSNEKKNVQKYYSKLKIRYKAELSDLNSLKERLDFFIQKATEYYLKSVQCMDHNDRTLDKFLALWLEQSFNNDINRILSVDILSIASYKLINWSTQLISRLSQDDSQFQKILTVLVIRLCREHPHHTSYHLISLMMHESHDKQGYNFLLASKSAVAKDIWQRIISLREPVTSLLLGIEHFCREAVKLAAYKLIRGRSFNLKKNKIGSYWVNDLPNIPPPTLNLPIDLCNQYKNLPYFTRVNLEVKIAASGLSLPKILSFQLSNGMEHKILFKHGSDNLRQDSIMEQVFGRVNGFFRNDKEAKRRELNVRTYTVIPLGSEAGIIEFVTNSTALIDIIKPYHQERDGISLEKARDLMKSVQTCEKNERYQVFHTICSKVKPVLRHFFFETFLSSEDWFNSRTTYTRGIASSSIVGYIMGLGDRHCNNILLDMQTGEPIHIDLGVAFDQGKQLPIPETVPFRLTRDIVDGFGITGTRGVFSKACEQTFRILRDHREHILAILDVLRWDPLYSWTISPLTRKRLQEEGFKSHADDIDFGHDGSEGARAILVVSDKLIASGLRNEAIVRELIQDAADPHNLALVYCGWCPFY